MSVQQKREYFILAVRALHLVARNEEELKTIADELGAKFIVGDVNDPKFFAKVMENIDTPCDGEVYAVGGIDTAFKLLKT